MSQQDTPASSQASLESIAARLDRMERTLARFDRRFDQVLDHGPAVVATAVDAVDEMALQAAARGIDIDARMQAMVQLTERVTEPATLQALSGLVAQLDAVPNLVATLVDAIDEMAQTAQDSGLDLPAVVRAVTDLLGYGARLMQTDEFRQLIESGLPDARQIGTLANLRSALADTGGEPAGRAGFLALWRATRDPDVQRALDFGIRFLKRCGRIIDESASDPLVPLHSEREATTTCHNITKS